MKIFEVMDCNESFKKIPEQYKPKKHSFNSRSDELLDGLKATELTDEVDQTF